MSDPPFLDLPPAHSVDSLPVRTTTADLLDLDRVAAHIVEATARRRYRGPTDPLGYLLHKRCLVAVGGETYATLAGILCFGRQPQATFPTALVDIGRYRGIEAVSYDVAHLEKGIGGTIFDQLARIEEYLAATMNRGMTLDTHSFQRIEVPEYPYAVIRELCVNMLVHRDYLNFLTNARIQIFRNRIEWISPGGLPNGITVENLLQEQAARNPVILSVLYEAGFVEAFGQGLDTVVAVLKQEEMLPPRFEDTGASFIVAVYGRDMTMLDGQSLGGLSDSQRMMLTYVRAQGEVSPRQLREMFPDRSERSIQRDIRTLIEEGYAEQVGGTRSLVYRALNRV